MVQNASRRAGGAGSGIVDLIARNPMAATLAGIGLGWMLLGSRQESGSIPAASRYYPGSGRYAGPASWTSTDTQPMGGQLSDLGEKVGEKLGEAQTAARGAIDQVQETAGTVAGQAQGMAQSFGGNAADAGSSLLDTIQQIPVPAAIAAASLSYLLFNRPGGQAPAPIYEARNRAGEAASQLRDSTGQLAEDAQGAAGEMVGRVQQATGRVMDQAQGTIGGVGGSLQTQALHTRYRFEQLFNDHPLVVGAAALALGMVVGLPVPSTQQEHELIGQVSGRVIDRAQSVAHETAQKLQQAVEQQGPDEELRRRAREVAEEAEQLADRLNRPA